MEKIKVGLINGPNLNMIGSREPELYGKLSLDSLIRDLKIKAGSRYEIFDFQSNSEGDLIDFIQQADTKKLSYIILNAGAYSHYSIAIRDAIKLVKAKVIEVHITNIYAREEFRHTSMISPVCVGQICGFGLYSYLLAMEYIMIMTPEG